MSDLHDLPQNQAAQKHARTILESLVARFQASKHLETIIGTPVLLLDDIAWEIFDTVTEGIVTDDHVEKFLIELRDEIKKQKANQRENACRAHL